MRERRTPIGWPRSFGRGSPARASLRRLPSHRENELIEIIVGLDLVPATTVLVDLSEVVFVDSSGLRGLLKTQVYLRGRGCELHLVRPCKQLLRLIDIVGFTDVLTVVDGKALYDTSQG